jgi:hypothetical protein
MKHSFNSSHIIYWLAFSIQSKTQPRSRMCHVNVQDKWMVVNQWCCLAFTQVNLEVAQYSKSSEQKKTNI